MRNFTKTGGRPASGSRPSGSRPSAPAASLEGEHLEYLRRRGAPWGEPPVAGAAAPPEGARRRARIVDFWPGGALDTYRLRSRRRARRRAGWPWSARRGGCAARTRASLHAACRRNDSSAARLFLRRDGQAFCETPLAEIEEGLDFCFLGKRECWFRRGWPTTGHTGTGGRNTQARKGLELERDKHSSRRK